MIWMTIVAIIVVVLLMSYATHSWERRVMRRGEFCARSDCPLVERYEVTTADVSPQNDVSHCDCDKIEPLGEPHVAVYDESGRLDSCAGCPPYATDFRPDIRVHLEYMGDAGDGWFVPDETIDALASLVHRPAGTSVTEVLNAVKDVIENQPYDT